MLKFCACYADNLHLYAPLSPASPSSFTAMFESSASSLGSTESMKKKILSVIRNFSTVTGSLFISERLPRFDEMVFINLTTLEGEPYCVELTKQGWRIASTDHDSMNGDFRRMDLFIVYHNSLSDLLKGVSPRFEEILNQSQLLTPSSSSCCSSPRSASP